MLEIATSDEERSRSSSKAGLTEGRFKATKQLLEQELRALDQDAQERREEGNERARVQMAEAAEKLRLAEERLRQVQQLAATTAPPTAATFVERAEVSVQVQPFQVLAPPSPPVKKVVAGRAEGKDATPSPQSQWAMQRSCMKVGEDEAPGLEVAAALVSVVGYERQQSPNAAAVDALAGAIATVQVSPGLATTAAGRGMLPPRSS